MKRAAGFLSIALAACGSAPEVSAPGRQIVELNTPADQSVVAQKPGPAKSPVDQNPGRATPKADQNPGRATPQRADQDKAHTDGSEPIIGRMLPNRLRILQLPAERDELARLTLSIDAGPSHDPEGKWGLARLTAHTLRASGAGGREGEVLDETLERFDAELTLRVEGRFVYFEGTCPAENLLDLQEALRRMATQPAPSREVVRKEIARLRSVLAAERSERVRLWQLSLALGGRKPDPVRVEENLANLSAADVALFYGTHYRPQYAVVAVQLHNPPEDLFTGAEKKFSRWQVGPQTPALMPEGKVLPVAFARTDGPLAEVYAIIRSPDPELVGTGLGEIAWQWLCLDGTGGLVGKRLKRHGLQGIVPRVEQFSTGLTMVRALVLETTPDRVPDVLTALREAWSESASSMPERGELHIARRRALFLWDRKIADPATRVRTFLTGYLAGHGPNLDREVLASFQSVAPFDPQGFARQRFVPALVVRGPEEARPEDAVPLPAPREMRETAEANQDFTPLKLDEKELEKLVEVVLRRCVSALGGERELKGATSFGYRAESRFRASVPFTESWSIQLPKGPIERKRSILGTTIRTIWSDGRAREEVDGERTALEEGAADLLWLESRLNPGILLGTVLRGSIQPKAIGHLTSGDRRLLVLLINLSEEHEVFVAIDEKNGLPRRLRYKEWLPKTAPQNVTLLFRDYRQVGSLRLPHSIFRYVVGEYRGEVSLSYR